MKFGTEFLLGMAKILPRGYWRVLKVAAERDPALQDFPIHLKDTPIPLRADLRESVYCGLFREGLIPHQIGLDKVVKNLIQNGDLVFDIGANIGYTSAVFSTLVGDTGRVIAAEPSPTAYRLLSRSLNGISNISLINVALSSIRGELDFYVPEFLDRASLDAIAGAKKIVVKTRILDDLSAEYGLPSLIKIDVEGREEDVFRGAISTLGAARKPVIVFEALDDKKLNNCRSIISDLSHGCYKFARITFDGRLADIDQKQKASNDYVASPSRLVESI